MALIVRPIHTIQVANVTLQLKLEDAGTFGLERTDRVLWSSDEASRSVLPKLKLTGKRILELGSGSTGVLGLAAAALGARSVILTDREEVLPTLRANVLRNVTLFSDTVLECRALDWSKPLAPIIENEIDLVLACDCLYESNVSIFDSTLRKILSRHRKAVAIIINQSSVALAKWRRKYEKHSVNDAYRLDDLAISTTSACLQVSRRLSVSVQRDGLGFLFRIKKLDLGLEARDFVLDELNKAKRAPIAESRFGAVRSPEFRYDLKLEARADAVGSFVLTTIDYLDSEIRRLFSSQPLLYEYGAMVSEPGAALQPWHADTRCDNEEDQAMVTFFIALSRITHGHTLLLPKTHTSAFHKIARSEFFDGRLLSFPVIHKLGIPVVRSTLDIGDICAMASTLFHAGGAHDGTEPRVLLYFSLRDPNRPRPRGSTGTCLPHLIDLSWEEFLHRLRCS
uniref:Calmodulin-lysine N-methyltransferase n=1 Tax=Aureoumbra lagunensis TaxID=44058 RepID=A0A7S3JTL5_9STRA|mmetsp:Transcript_10569/g.15958  ORF Transcript_10569/g.15958 Transcript_10569/m.15958 type:complete len:453 (+) Transcript_10569:44-1402(+)